MKCLFAAPAKPVVSWDDISKSRIAVNMTTIKVTHIAYKKHIFVIASIAMITNEIIKLVKLHIPLLDLNNLSFLFDIFVIDSHFNKIYEFSPAAWTICWCFNPLLNAFCTEFVSALQNTPDIRIWIETYGADILILCACFVLNIDCYSAKFCIFKLFGVLFVQFGLLL